MKRLIIILLLAVALLMPNFAAPGEVDAATQFSDLKTSHWAYDNIMKLVGDDVISGYPDGTFLPEGFITEAEFLKMAVMASGNYVTPESFKAAQLQNSEKSWKWYEQYYFYADENGYPAPVSSVNEKADRFFAVKYVDAILTAEYGETRQILAADLQAKYSDWGDFAKVGAVYDVALHNCMAKGVVTGYPDDTIGGGRNITRAEAATMICRMMYDEMRIEVTSQDDSGEQGAETVIKEPQAELTQTDWLSDQLELCTDSEMDDMNKALSIAEHLCEYLSYSEKKGNDFGEYPKTLEIARTTADDEGYAMRYYLLCDEAGVECQIVTPPIGDHVWNRVKLDGIWYYIDVAMMDAGSGVDYNYSLIPSMLPDHDVYGDEADYKFDIIYSL